MTLSLRSEVAAYVETLSRPKRQQVKRNWSAILVDAGIRNLTNDECATEQGCTPEIVKAASHRYGLILRGRSSRGVTTPAAKDKMRATAEAKWIALFADASETETINAFCARKGVSFKSAQRWAIVMGHTFAPLTNAQSAMRRASALKAKLAR